MNGHPKKESKPKIFGRKISGEAPGKLRAHIIKCIRLAEGVVSEPFLPSGDQVHKGGFATLPKQHPIARGITNEIPHENGA